MVTLARSIIRAVVFSYVALYLTQFVIGALSFSNSSFISLYTLIVFALAAINFFMKPVMAIIGLPSKGIFFMFMSFVLTVITLYALTVILPSFTVNETVVQELRFFGFVLPSKQLTVNWAIIYSALSFSVIYSFFIWLSSCND